MLIYNRKLLKFVSFKSSVTRKVCLGLYISSYATENNCVRTRNLNLNFKFFVWHSQKRNVRVNFVWSKLRSQSFAKIRKQSINRNLNELLTYLVCFCFFSNSKLIMNSKCSANVASKSITKLEFYQQSSLWSNLANKSNVVIAVSYKHGRWTFYELV